MFASSVVSRPATVCDAFPVCDAQLEEDLMSDAGPQRAAPRSPRDTLTDMILAYRLSQLIYVAARLGIADLLSAGPKRSEDLAERCGVQPDALYRVLRALASNGI